MADVQTVQVESLVASIVAERSSSLADCIALLEELQKPSCLSESDIALLTRAVNTQLGKSTPTKNGNGNSQTHLSFFDCMSKEDWATRTDERREEEQMAATQKEASRANSSATPTKNYGLQQTVSMMVTVYYISL